MIPKYFAQIDNKNIVINLAVVESASYAHDICEMISNATCVSPNSVDHLNDYPPCEWITIDGVNVTSGWILYFEIMTIPNTGSDLYDIEMCSITPPINGTTYNLSIATGHGSFTSIPYLEQVEKIFPGSHTIYDMIKPQYWFCGETNKYYLFYLKSGSRIFERNVYNIQVNLYQNPSATINYYNETTFTSAGGYMYWYELFYVEVTPTGTWSIKYPIDPDTGNHWPKGRPRNRPRNTPPWPSSYNNT